LIRSPRVAGLRWGPLQNDQCTYILISKNQVLLDALIVIIVKGLGESKEASHKRSFFFIPLSAASISTCSCFCYTPQPGFLRSERLRQDSSNHLRKEIRLGPGKHFQSGSKFLSDSKFQGVGMLKLDVVNGVVLDAIPMLPQIPRDFPYLVNKGRNPSLN
jgi:hypothetical protein